MPDSLTILLVEDHAETAELLRKLLSAEGYSVALAHTITDATELCERQRFDLLMCDMQFPTDNAAQVMSCAARHGTPGIVVSGHSLPEHLAVSRSAGFAAHLVKPVSMGQLRDAIARVSPSKHRTHDIAPAGTHSPHADQPPASS